MLKNIIITFLMKGNSFIFVKNGCFTPSYRIRDIKTCKNVANIMQCNEIPDAAIHIVDLLSDSVKGI